MARAWYPPAPSGQSLNATGICCLLPSVQVTVSVPVAPLALAWVALLSRPVLVAPR